MATQTEERIAHVNVWLTTDLRERLVELARTNERSISAELRRAIRAHVERDNDNEEEA